MGHWIKKKIGHYQNTSAIVDLIIVEKCYHLIQTYNYIIFIFIFIYKVMQNHFYSIASKTSRESFSGASTKIFTRAFASFVFCLILIEGFKDNA
jgi:hypothetical protein